MSDQTSIQDFYDIVSAIIENTQKLKQYDSFAATALSSVINLMLSRDDEYVKLCSSQPSNTIQIPDTVKENVDNIIAAVKNKIKKGKTKKSDKIAPPVNNIELLSSISTK